MSENTQSEKELIEKLTKLIQKVGLKQTEEGAPQGACVYTAGTGTYCAVLEKSACDALGGTWVQGGKCN